MGDIALCRLSPARLEILRTDPSLTRALRAEIKRGSVPNALRVGSFGVEKNRNAPDLVWGQWSALTRRERLEARFSRFGPNAWKWICEILEGHVGESLRSYARVLSPLLVRRAAAAMRKSPEPAPPRSVEGVADAIRAFFEAASETGEHVLVLGPKRPLKPASR
jgi:hypothetical protein